jgi:hypothetical protein
LSSKFRAAKVYRTDAVKFAAVCDPIERIFKQLIKISQNIMIIEGNAQFIPDNEFKPKIQKALDLLKKKAPIDYATLTYRTEKIRAAEKTGAVVMDAFINVGRDTFSASLTWLASVLIHENFHNIQCQYGLKYTGREAEQAANVIQLSVLRSIGAPQEEIAYMMSQDGMHFDLDGDGKYTQRDYDRRTY